MPIPCLAAVAALMLATASGEPGTPAGGGSSPSPYQHGLASGGELAPHADNCVPPALAQQVHAAFAEFHRTHPARGTTTPDPQPPGGVAGGGPVIQYPFLPLGGTPDHDIFIGGFVDLDPASPGFHDYACDPFTYNGHEGCDIELRSFAEQFIGVPVFAALDGTVTFASDGYEDAQLGCTEQGNIVAIDHGGNRESSYYHLKKNSVLVSVGQIVKAGQQIGMAGSSGCSFGPHLHFQTTLYTSPPFGYVIYEPFAGDCRPGPSGWVNQPPLSTAMFLSDFGPTSVDLADPKLVTPYPFPQPRQGRFAINDPFVRFWLRGYNLATQSTWRVRFLRPGGQTAWDSNWFFFNDEIWRTYFFTWEYDFQKMGPQLGIWHILVEFNDQVMINAPFEVVASLSPPVNHAPEPITVSLDPPSPAAGNVIFARLNTSVLLDDLDYDIVRYHYVWKVNGTTVRDVTTAGQRDAIARNSACPGALLQVTVTPNDGTVNGTPASASVNISGTPSADLNCDGHVNGLDLAQLLGAWSGALAYTPCPPYRQSDLNHDCKVNGLDLALLLGAWG